MMTFAEFQATKRYCDDLCEALGFDAYDKEGETLLRGYIYTDDCHIEWVASGVYRLTLGRDIYESANIEELEAMLYSWALTELPDDMGVPESVHEFLCQLQDSMTPQQFAAAMLANRDEANPSVCHMQDYCDANECALAAADTMRGRRMHGDAYTATLGDYEGDTDELIAEADEIYTAARPFIRGSAR